MLLLYKIDNDKEQREADEQANQDRIVIYNEIIDVLKSILFIITNKDKASRKSPKLFEEPKTPGSPVSEEFNIEKIMYE